MPAQLHNEFAILQLAQSGSTEAFGVLVDRYEQQVYRLLRAITADDEEAEELLEATFSTAHENLGVLNSEERFHTWLARIAINAAVFKLRQRHAFAWDSFDELVDDADAIATPGNVQEWSRDPRGIYSKAELNAILSRALEDLETPLRMVFVLGDMEGFSLKEIAGILGLPIPVARTYWTRARLKLRGNLSIRFENLSVSDSPGSGHGNGHDSRGPA
ncbi:MAG TPA: sigma-70 family RNA polymerase sigma factor [Terriglobia bacterium]|nr:sigma-70 family RNA polymerase sigma factor [Terriglobia bacterium]